MCCGRVGGVVVVVGAALVVLGVSQLLVGTYFMLTLPIFQLGSNIWTGSWSGLCGLVVASIGWKKQAMRRGQVILVATLSVLVADVANLVILQVGEHGVFLSDEDWRSIVAANQELSLQIACWVTTILAGVGIVVSFSGAQYLFCVVVRGPRVKGRMPVTRSLSEEDLQQQHHHRQQVQTTRFISPSLVLAATTTPTTASHTDDATTLPATHASGSGGGGGAVTPMHGLNGGGGGGGVGGGVNGGDKDVHKDSRRYTRRGSSSKGGVGGGNGGKNVPYFLRNHQSSWHYILPEMVREIESKRMSAMEPYEQISRASTLSRHSKSSFQPHRPVYPEGDNRQEGLTPEPHQMRPSRPPSSCSTSLYSVPESGSEAGQSRRSGRVVRPSVPPPAPPPFSSSSLRSVTAGGWESCAVMQYPGQRGSAGGGGFVVDLD
ncbi:hypothetical protein Pmani_037156 [Petrolisthes manimaculis]|uniref:Uncharacterized protein n=1 Tax=Petrolisthes manimaculis TaxID=1843537 RepID=A0AAE1NJQ9_9EUCA|nr:hypothetical protein Pmani_037156 [Petrolisthes manimaculis]